MMLKRTLVLFCAALGFSACLKENTTDETYYLVDAIDSEVIELFLRTHKVVEGEYGPEMVEVDLSDPNSLWNTRRTEPLTEDTPYEDLIGHVFEDTTHVRLVTSAGDTVPVPAGVWVYVNKRGYSQKRPADSSAVLVTYTGTLLNDKQFTINPYGVTIYLYQDNIVGFRLGMKYFEMGHLVTETITPEPNEDGTQDPPYEQTTWQDNGQGWVFIPSQVGYGNTLASDVPPYSVLVYKVDLLSIADYPGTSSEEAVVTPLGKETTMWMNLPPAGKTVKENEK